MGELDLDSKSVQIATMVILHAGNARKMVHEALTHAEAFRFKEADESLKNAKNEMHKAHVTQTEIIQAEARGEPAELTMLMTHAQDTLMIAMSEVQMAKHLIEILKKIQLRDA